jgi:translation initiation factor 5A
VLDMSKPSEIGSVKVGHHIIIDGEPCRVVSYDHSKPGKHGSAKARIVAIGVFDDVKRSIVSPVSARIEIPIIEKRTSQIISKSENAVQLMDMETYEVFETALPKDEEIRSKISNGAEAEYWKILGKVKIVRVKE